MSLTPPDQDLIGIINQIEKDLDEVQFYISGESLGENGPSVPSGGTTGQALIKASNTDGDTVWQTVDINSVTVGTTTTGSPGTSASVTNSGTANELILDFVIPKGDKGDTGDTGPQGPAYATVSVGSVTTGNAGTNASITNSGTSSAAVFNFTIPRGDKGDTGDAATISVGTVTTTASGTTASVVNSGTSGEAVFDFEIPRGDKGDTGEAGADGNVTLYGAGPPSNSLGVDDDFYIDTSAGMVYGPKAGGSWPASGPIQTPGPQGPQGPTGASSSRLFFLY